MKKTKEFEELLHVFSQLAVLKYSEPGNESDKVRKLQLLEDSTRNRLDSLNPIRNRSILNENLKIGTNTVSDSQKQVQDHHYTINRLPNDPNWISEEFLVSHEAHLQQKAASHENAESYMKVCFIHGAEHLKNESPQLFDLRERFNDFKNHGEYVFLEVQGKRFFEQNDTVLLDEYIILNCFTSLLLGYMVGFNQRQFTHLIEKLNGLNYTRLAGADSATFLAVLDQIVTMAKKKEHTKIEALLTVICRSDHESKFLSCLVWSFKKILGEYLNELKINKKNSYLSKYYITDHLFFQLGEVRPEDRSLYKMIRYCIEVFFLTIDAYCELVYIRRADLEYHYKNIFINKPKETLSKKLLLYLVEIDERLTIFTCHEHQYGLQTTGFGESRVAAGERRQEQGRLAMSRPQSVDPRANQPEGLVKDRNRHTLDGQAKQDEKPLVGHQGLSGLIRSEKNAPSQLSSGHPYPATCQDPSEGVKPFHNMYKTGKSTTDTLGGSRDGSEMTALPTNQIHGGHLNQVLARREDPLSSEVSGMQVDQNKQIWNNQPSSGISVPQESLNHRQATPNDARALALEKVTGFEAKTDQEANKRVWGTVEQKEIVLFDFDRLMEGVQELVATIEANSRKLALIKQAPSRGHTAGSNTTRGHSQSRPVDLQSNVANSSSQYPRGRSIGRADYAHLGANRFGSRGSGKSQDILSHRFGGIPSYGTAAGLHTSSGLAGYQAAAGNQMNQLGSGHSGLNSYNGSTGHQMSSLSTNRYPGSGALGFNSSSLGLNSYPVGSISAQNSKQSPHQLGSLGTQNTGLGLVSHPSQRSPARFNHLDGGYSPSSQIAAALGGLTLNSSKSHQEKGIPSYSNNPGSSTRYGLGNQGINLQDANQQTEPNPDLTKKLSLSSPTRHTDQQPNLLLNQIY